MSKPTAVIVGASSGVGRTLAEKLAIAGINLIISSRDTTDLEALSQHLRLTYGVHVQVAPLDLSTGNLTAYVERCIEQNSSIRYIYIPAGNVHDEDDGTMSEEDTESLLYSNYESVIKLTGLFAKHLEAKGSGTIGVFSSIAAAAPRSKNVVYSSAKRGLETYCKGLQHRFADSEIKIQVYALGYVDTAMTFGKKLLFPVSSPENVAMFVVANRDKNLRFSYYPKFWKWVVLIMNSLPWFIYKRLKF